MGGKRKGGFRCGSCGESLNGGVIGVEIRQLIPLVERCPLGRCQTGSWDDGAGDGIEDTTRARVGESHRGGNA